MEGFLGTRGNFVIDLVMTISGFLPFFMLFAFYLAAIGKKHLHKYLQIILFSTVLILVVALETSLQFGGLSNISKQSPYSGTIELTILFIVHLIFATSSFLGWLWLIIKSAKRYPDAFDFDHKKWGKILFWDIVLMVITGWILYWMTFVA